MAKFKIDPEELGDSATMEDARKLAAWLTRHGYDTIAVDVAPTGGPSIPAAVFYKGMDEVFNSRAANARILDRDGRTVKVGDRVRLAGTSSPGLGKMGVVFKIDDDWGDVTVKTEDGKTYEYEASAVVKIANSSPVRSRNAVVAKALNTEDAQGHEHGDDGRFTSKDGGSSDGGYEDPKIKRMRERLAKMREKNEALRKDIEARKAGLAKKKADTEKMRSEIMKANVEKWKASLKSKNSIVQKALNACGTARNASFFCDERDYRTIADVKREYPAQIVKRVTGGWMVFDTVSDFETWRRQR